MTTPTIRKPATAQDVKDLLASGKTVQETADATGFPRGSVLAVINGWPGYLHDMATDKAIRPGKAPGAKVSGPRPTPKPTSPKAAPTAEVPEVVAPSPGHEIATAASEPTPPETEAPPAQPLVRKPDRLMDAIETALGCLDDYDDPAVGDDVQRARDALARLRTTLATSEELRQAEATLAAAEQALAAARAKVAELRGERPAAAPAAPVDPAAGPAAKPAPAARPAATNREIRDWATTNGISCPTVGRIPVRVLDAYTEAHNQEGTPNP